jgi:hypothetical protein
MHINFAGRRMFVRPIICSKSVLIEERRTNNLEKFSPLPTLANSGRIAIIYGPSNIYIFQSILSHI